jgi:hypothetical protein
MFTLSDKQRVLNTASNVKVFSPANVLRTTSAAIAATDKLFIDGFGHFDLASITDIHCRRAVAAVAESEDYTVTVPAGLAIGDTVEVRIQMNTSRYQGELAVQARLGGAHYFIFTTTPLTAVGATDVVTAIIAGFAAYKASYPNGTFPFTVSTGATTSKFRVTAAAGYESISFVRTEIRRGSNNGTNSIGTQPYISLAPTLIAAGNEGKFLGKFIEESIRMATPLNTNPYGLDNADTAVDIRGKYTCITFTINANYEENLSTLAADNGPLPATHKFELYLNENTCLAANSAIAQMAAIAVLRATALTPALTAAGAISAGNFGAVPNERTEVLWLASEISTTSVANFIF